MRQFDNTIFKLDVHLQSVEPNLSQAVSCFDREVLDLISQKYGVAAVLETLAAIGFEALEEAEKDIKEGLVLNEEEKALCKQEIYQDLLLYAASVALNTEENDVRVRDSYIV